MKAIISSILLYIQASWTIFIIRGFDDLILIESVLLLSLYLQIYAKSRVSPNYTGIWDKLITHNFNESSMIIRNNNADSRMKFFIEFFFIFDLLIFGKYIQNKIHTKFEYIHFILWYRLLHQTNIHTTLEQCWENGLLWKYWIFYQ